MGSGQSKAADTARDEVDAFNQKYPVGSRVLVRWDDRTTRSAEVLTPAFLDPRGCVAVVRVRFDADKPRLDQRIATDRVLGFDERPAPEASQTIEPKPRQSPEQFCQGRYAVDVDEGGYLRVLCHGVRQGTSHHALIGDMLTRIRDLRAELAEAKALQTETLAPEPVEDPALPILREVRDHQVHGHAIDPDDHVVVYCWSRGDVITNGLSPVVWHRNGEALAEATMHLANAGRRGADRYEVTTLRAYLEDCRARATAEDFSPAFAHRLTEPADTNPAPWPVPFAMPPVDSVMAPDLFFAARFDEIRRRAQRDLDRRADEDEAPCDHTPWESVLGGVVCKTCRVPMRFVGPGQGWEPVPGASAQVGESEGT